MSHHVGLDVSQKLTAICVVDDTDRRLWRGQCTSDAEPIERAVRRHRGEDARLGLETGPMTSTMRRDWRRSCARDGIARCSKIVRFPLSAGLAGRASPARRHDNPVLEPSAVSQDLQHAKAVFWRRCRPAFVIELQGTRRAEFIVAWNTPLVDPAAKYVLVPEILIGRFRHPLRPVAPALPL